MNWGGNKDANNTQKFDEISELLAQDYYSLVGWKRKNEEFYCTSMCGESF